MGDSHSPIILDEGREGSSIQPQKRRRRDIRACGSCRRSKVKCDGNKPCTRCAHIKAECIYHEVIKDPSVERIEHLEMEVRRLKSAMEGFHEALHRSNSMHNTTTPVSIPEGLRAPQPLISPPAAMRNPLVPSESSLTNGMSAYPDSSTNGSYEVSSSTGMFRDCGTSYIPRNRWRAFQCRAENLPNAIQKGVVTGHQASIWFETFFRGNHHLVPIFCLKTDTYTSVLSRSAFLFDAIIAVGSRTEDGSTSSAYQRLQSLIRDHLASTILRSGTGQDCTIETIQALLVVASYSENGWLLVSHALSLALQQNLPKLADDLMTKIAERKRTKGPTTDEERKLFRTARVWYGVFNLEHIFSLDGEKPPNISFTNPRTQLRALVYHPERTIVDIRLFSQVELNILRATSHSSLLRCWEIPGIVDIEAELAAILRDARIDLDLWLEEWTAIIHSSSQEYQSAKERNLAFLNLRIQHTWALINLHLKALSNTGIENIAIMTPFQRDIVCTVKDEAVRHLDLLLEASSSPPTPEGSPPQRPPIRSIYLSGFKWAMDFVWAKCAFSILLVLRLTMLLRDPPERLMELLHKSRTVLEELKQESIGNIAYFQILQSSVEKCEHALQEWMSQQSSAPLGRADSASMGGESQTAEEEFEGYVPKEFLFEWNFSGLNLRHVPLRWQDLFFDFENVL